MKQLKFADNLIPLIQSKHKDTTWRINDDKNIQENDILSLCNINKQPFAKAKIIKVKTTTFDNLSKEDMQGHEKFNSFEHMLQTYSTYYNMQVTSQTEVKIIKFELI